MKVCVCESAGRVRLMIDGEEIATLDWNTPQAKKLLRLNRISTAHDAMMLDRASIVAERDELRAELAAADALGQEAEKHATAALSAAHEEIYRLKSRTDAGALGQLLYVCTNDASTREGTLTGKDFSGACTISTEPNVPGWENDGAYPGYGLSWEWAAFLVDAANSYSKACGPRAVECAEADLLGEALAALRRVGISRVERPASGGTFVHHGWHCEICGADWEGAQAPQQHTPDCVLAKASGEAKAHGMKP